MQQPTRHHISTGHRHKLLAIIASRRRTPSKIEAEHLHKHNPSEESRHVSLGLAGLAGQVGLSVWLAVTLLERTPRYQSTSNQQLREFISYSTTSYYHNGKCGSLRRGPCSIVSRQSNLVIMYLAWVKLDQLATKGCIALVLSRIDCVNTERIEPSTIRKGAECGQDTTVALGISLLRASAKDMVTNLGRRQITNRYIHPKYPRPLLVIDARLTIGAGLRTPSIPETRGLTSDARGSRCPPPNPPIDPLHVLPFSMSLR